MGMNIKIQIKCDWFRDFSEQIIEYNVNNSEHLIKILIERIR